MSKVYLPNFTSSNCIVIKDKDTIRVYSSLPQQNQSVNYIDYYINSHYLENKGTELIDIVPACADYDDFTTEVYYRNDISDIMITFIIIALICFYIPYKIFIRAFGRWLKV